ncbi:hypothetical protein J6590_065671 [Homalodisca vitripennis]|nr:hypothetical protein J6590_065671 [Homalodisca vitripennis]
MSLDRSQEHKHVTPEVHKTQTGESEPNRCHCTGIECTDTSRPKNIVHRYVTPEVHETQTGESDPNRSHCTGIECTDTSRPKNRVHRYVTPEVHETQTGESEPNRCHCTGIEHRHVTPEVHETQTGENIVHRYVTPEVHETQTGESEPNRNIVHRYVTPEVHETQTGESDPNRSHCTGIECTDTSRPKCMKPRLERSQPVPLHRNIEHRHVTPEVHETQTGNNREHRHVTPKCMKPRLERHRHVTPEVHETQTGESDPTGATAQEYSAQIRHARRIECTDTSRPKCMKPRLERVIPTGATAQEYSAQIRHARNTSRPKCMKPRLERVNPTGATAQEYSADTSRLARNPDWRDDPTRPLHRNRVHRYVTPEVHETQTGESDPNRCHCTGIECIDTSRPKCMKPRLERVIPTGATAQE